MGRAAETLMDFHKLPRRKLQQLCKKHGIAANKTNLFMAESLLALKKSGSSEEAAASAAAATGSHGDDFSASQCTSITAERKSADFEEINSEEMESVKGDSAFNNTGQCQIASNDSPNILDGGGVAQIETEDDMHVLEEPKIIKAEGTDKDAETLGDHKEGLCQMDVEAKISACDAEVIRKFDDADVQPSTCANLVALDDCGEESKTLRSNDSDVVPTGDWEQSDDVDNNVSCGNTIADAAKNGSNAGMEPSEDAHANNNDAEPLLVSAFDDPCVTMVKELDSDGMEHADNGSCKNMVAEADENRKDGGLEQSDYAYANDKDVEQVFDDSCVMAVEKNENQVTAESVKFEGTCKGEGTESLLVVTKVLTDLDEACVMAVEKNENQEPMVMEEPSSTAESVKFEGTFKGEGTESLLVVTKMRSLKSPIEPDSSEDQRLPENDIQGRDVYCPLSSSQQVINYTNQKVSDAPPLIMDSQDGKLNTALVIEDSKQVSKFSTVSPSHGLKAREDYCDASPLSDDIYGEESGLCSAEKEIEMAYDRGCDSMTMDLDCSVDCKANVLAAGGGIDHPPSSTQPSAMEASSSYSLQARHWKEMVERGMKKAKHRSDYKESPFFKRTLVNRSLLRARLKRAEVLTQQRTKLTDTYKADHLEGKMFRHTPSAAVVRPSKADQLERNLLYQKTSAAVGPSSLLSFSCPNLKRSCLGRNDTGHDNPEADLRIDHPPQPIFGRKRFMEKAMAESARKKLEKSGVESMAVSPLRNITNQLSKANSQLQKNVVEDLSAFHELINENRRATLSICGGKVAKAQKKHQEQFKTPLKGKSHQKSKLVAIKLASMQRNVTLSARRGLSVSDENLD